LIPKKPATQAKQTVPAVTYPVVFDEAKVHHSKDIMDIADDDDEMDSDIKA
tara:strand:- start:158 stop:310 length:153 start_codon:yes stop_codon:yes gene_type:complete